MALEDRCCHRHAPLSKGRLEGSDVRCMYHGLKFAPTGECIEIPGEARVPKQMKVQTFPLVEKDKLLWIWLGDAALADADRPAPPLILKLALRFAFNVGTIDAKLATAWAQTQFTDRLGARGGRRLFASDRWRVLGGHRPPEVPHF